MLTAPTLPVHALRLKGRLLSLDSPKVMGIVNLTPDSFFGGSRAASVSAAVERARQMAAEGADMLDLGAMSTRPGAEDVSVEEELDRLLPALAAIREVLPEMPLSVDTFRAEVARQALEAGADIINDVTGGEDPAMYATVAEAGAPYILMHMRGNPRTMSGLTEYKNLFLDIQAYLLERVAAARSAGVGDIVLDPGLGFAKTTEQNFTLLRELERFQALGLPVLVGLSRKGMIWKTLGIRPEDALNGTTALHTAALAGGASILRVHDVAEARQVIRLWAYLRGERD